MKDDILFYENQSILKQKILLIVLLPIISLLIWGFIQQVFLNLPFGNKPMSNVGLSIFVILFTAISTVFLLSKMETFITEEGIYVKYFPLLLKTKFYSWDNIQAAYIRKYSPMREFGGWGVKYSFGSGKVYNVYGNRGLQLIFQDGKKILIGSNRVEELEDILKKLDDKRKQK